MRLLFTIYADFESFSVTIETCQNDPEESCTQKLQKHISSPFVFYLVTTTGVRYKPVWCTVSANEDIAEIFVEKLIEHAKMIYEKYENKKDMIFTDDDENQYDNAKVCHNVNCGSYWKKYLKMKRYMKHLKIIIKSQIIVNNRQVPWSCIYELWFTLPSTWNLFGSHT